MHFYTLLLYFLYKSTIIQCKIIIEDCGIKEIDDNDIALIFFLTIRNTNENPVNISVEMMKCHEFGDVFNDNHMLLIGGNMGTFKWNETRNATLIYPNLYLRNRVGKCLISVQYISENCQGDMQQDIEFDTREDKSCKTFDLDEKNSCKPVDCVVKYSSMRSYFNRQINFCQPVVSCPLGSIYLPNSNECRNINKFVTEADLQELEEGQYKKGDSRFEMFNFECHHGQINSENGYCYCNDGWLTTSFPEKPYQPYLGIYHMCNIELTSWERSNRSKLFLTILVIFIFALAIIAKMLLAIYFLKWCYNIIRKKLKKSHQKESKEKWSPCSSQINSEAFNESETLEDEEYLTSFHSK